ncbi:MAG: autotransporter-associated beta strand repeat-containing protein [Chlamydiia bacterium]|nr:autotransporter-associated beta strand repeat-containing protein [Chlamydiia bacterium]
MKLIPVLLHVLPLVSSSLFAVINVSNTTELQNAIIAANTTPDTIVFSNSITLTGALPAVTNSYTIDGNGFSLDGASTYRGILVLGNSVSPTITNLTISNAVARGGIGGEAEDRRGGSGGGGLGAGGGIYVGNGADVTISLATFNTCSAVGGSSVAPSGGSDSAGGGGGGLGGQGGIGFGNNNGGGGGGGGQLIGNSGGNGAAGTGGTGGANGGGTGASPGVSAITGSYGGGGGGGAASATNSNAAAGGYGGGGGGGSSVNGSRAGGSGGFGAGGGGGGRTNGVGGNSIFGGGTGGNGSGNSGAAGGGGAALGGALFVDSTSTCTLNATGNPFTSSGVTGGTGANNGQALGIDIFLASGGTLKFNVSSGTFTFSNPIAGDSLLSTGGIEKLGVGILNMGSLSHTYRGTTTLSVGTLQVGASSGLGNSSSLILGGGTFEPTSSFTLSIPVSITAATIINTAGGVTLIESGVVSGTSGSLTKEGNGTLTLTGNNTYTVPTIINSGTLLLSGLTSTLGNSSSLTLSGGTFEIGSGSGTKTIGSLAGVAGSTITLNNNILEIPSGSFSGSITGTGIIRKTSGGTLALTPATSNSYSGGTNINGGVLSVNSSSSIGTGAVLIGDATLEITETASFSNLMSFSGNSILDVASGKICTWGGTIGGSSTSFQKNGSGVLVLTADNSYTVPTIISSGTLQLSGGTSTLGALSNLTINAFATLELATGAGTKAIGSLIGDIGSIINLNDNTLHINQSTDTTAASAISGVNGKLIKNGSGKLTLSGTNTYSGTTTIKNGTLLVSSDSNLGSGSLNLEAGTFEIAGSFNTSRPLIIAGNGVINTNTYSLMLNGTASGITGSLNKQGSGTLTLSGSNTYIVPTILSQGNIELSGSGTLGSFSDLNMSTGTSFTIASGAGTKAIGSLNGAIGSTINLNENVLQIKQIANGAFLGIISGTGGIDKQGTSSLTLEGNNSYSGGTEISQGTLNVSSDQNLGTGSITLDGGTLEPTSSFTSGKALIISNSSNISIPSSQTLTLNGTISGSASLNKQGEGTLQIIGMSNSYSGITNLSSGNLLLSNGSFGEVNVNANTILQGTGTLLSVINSGSVIPGASIGTIQVNGNYTQTTGGILFIEIDDSGNSDLIQVAGNATLAGTLKLDPLPGIYKAGTTYTIMTASTVSGVFDSFIENHPLDYFLTYQANRVLLSISFSGNVLPTPIDTLKGNAKKVGEYLFCSNYIPPNQDLVSVMRKLVKLDPLGFDKALVRLGSQQFGALALTNFQNSVTLTRAISDRLNSQYYTFADKCSLEKNSFNKAFFFQPIGLYYSQSPIQNQFGFDVRTFGWNSGVEISMKNHLFCNIDMGFLSSNLQWDKNVGRAQLYSVVLAPSIGYLRSDWYANCLVLLGRTFYSVDRHIAFPGLSRLSHNNHKSWDLNLGVEGGMKLDLTKILQPNLFVMPNIHLNYFNTWEGSYVEHEANSLNLWVKNKYSSFFQSHFSLKIFKTLTMHRLCLSPSIHLGYLQSIPISSGMYISRFYKQQTCKNKFVVNSYHKITNQMTLGTQLIFSKGDRFLFQLDYEAAIGDHSHIHQGKFQIKWDF